jgi:hypothetical protein
LISKVKGYRKSNIESETITFRIEKLLLDELRQESEQAGNSINTLINQLVKDHLQWHKPAKKAGLGYFSKIFLSRILDSLTEEQVIKTTKEFCKHNLFEISNMLRIKTTMSSFMDEYCTWLNASGFNYRLDKIDDLDVYVIQFDMGRKWSLYTKIAMQFVFEHYGERNAQCEMNNNLVIIKIKSNYKKK